MYKITIPDTLLVQSDEGLILRPETASELAEFERTVKFLKEQEDALKKAILDEMEANGIEKLITDEFTITYVAPGEREDFHKDAFRADHPDLYDQYTDLKEVRPYIRIKLK